MDMKRLRVVEKIYTLVEEALVNEVHKEDSREKVRMVNVQTDTPEKRIILQTLLAWKVVEPTEDRTIYVATERFFKMHKEYKNQGLTTTPSPCYNQLQVEIDYRKRLMFMEKTWKNYLDHVVGCQECPLTGNRPCDFGSPCDQCSYTEPSFEEWRSEKEQIEKCKANS